VVICIGLANPGLVVIEGLVRLGRRAKSGQGDRLQRLLRCGSTVTDQESGACLTQLVDARSGIRRVHRSRQAIGGVSQTRSVDASEELVVGPIPADAELPWSEAKQRV
jgi:hypothetical protein